jgi:hypothetical protein
MRAVGLCLLWCLSVAGASAADEARRIRIERLGRPIQLDGVLIEWTLSDARIADPRNRIAWDAVRTPEGLAGYVRTAGADSCAQWRFSFRAGENRWSFDTREFSGPGGYFAIDRELDSGIAVEWVIPWREFGEDSAFALEARGRSLCGDTTSVVFAGAVRQSRPSPQSSYRRLIPQAALILALLLAYLLLRRRAKKLRRR